MGKYSSEEASLLERAFAAGQEQARTGVTRLEVTVHEPTLNELATAIGYNYALWKGGEEERCECVVQLISQLIMLRPDYPPQSYWLRRCAQTFPTASFDKIGRVLIRQISSNKNVAVILGNAGFFISAQDFDRGCELLREAQSLDDSESLWSQFLGHFSFEQFHSARTPNKYKYAILTCNYLEKALEIDGMLTFVSAGEMAECAVFLRDSSLLNVCVNELRAYSEGYLDQFCNNLLGILHLKSGDTQAVLKQWAIVEDGFVWQRSTAELALNLIQSGYKLEVENMVNRLWEMKLIGDDLKSKLDEDLRNNIVDIEKADNWLL